MKYQEEVAKETLFVTVQRRGSDVAGLADTRWHGLIVQIEEEGKKEAELREEEEKEENRGFWFMVLLIRHYSYTLSHCVSIRPILPKKPRWNSIYRKEFLFFWRNREEIDSIGIWLNEILLVITMLCEANVFEHLANFYRLVTRVVETFENFVNVREHDYVGYASGGN